MCITHIFLPATSQPRGQRPAAREEAAAKDGKSEASSQAPDWAATDQPPSMALLLATTTPSPGEARQETRGEAESPLEGRHRIPCVRRTVRGPKESEAQHTEPATDVA